jgi:hypothetical protein
MDIPKQQQLGADLRPLQVMLEQERQVQQLQEQQAQERHWYL